MAGKRKNDDGTGSVTPKKRPTQEVEPKVKPAAKRSEEEDFPRGGASTLTPAEIREAREEADAEFEKGKGKKSGKKLGEGNKGLDNLDLRPISDAEPHRKKKKQDTPLPPRLDHLQSVEDHGIISSAEPQRKKKKKVVNPVPSTLVTSQIVEDHGLLSGAEPQRKKKKKEEEEVIPAPSTLVTSQIVEDHGLLSGAEPQRKKKKKEEEEVIPAPSTLVTSQIVEYHGLLSGAEPQRKKKKKEEEEVIPAPSTLVTSQIVEDHGLLSGAEPQRKKKKKEEEEVIPAPSTLVTSQIVEDHGLLSGAEPQRKIKKKTKKEVTPMALTLDSSQIVEDGLGSGAESHRKKKKRKFTTMLPASDPSQAVEDCEPHIKKKKKKTKKEVTSIPLTLDSSQIVEDGLGSGAESHRKKKKRKFTNMLPASDPSQAVEDCGPVTGSVKKTILKSQKPQAGNGAEPDRKNKKKVTFQLPDRAEDELSENELLGEETEFTDLNSSTWKTDKMRPGLVYGMYTAEEDGVLKQAIFDYIQEQGWDREEGLEKILNSRHSEARGCWHVIRKCLPQREVKRIYSRAHRILGPNTLLGKWTNEETQSLTELHSVHGNDWKRIAAMIGRDPQACKDKWRSIKWSNSKGYKTGAWSEEEQQKLYSLVLKCLHVKAQMAKRGLITKDHRLVRDDINWEFIAEQMDGRGRLDCLSQWYRKMASPMVTTGEWSNGDDQRLLARLMEEFPLSEELVEWDSLLKNRSGETCKKRWEQMQRTLGRGPEVRHQHFLEKLESIMKRFVPHLLDAEYDQKFAEELQRADADEPDDVDM